MELSDFFHQQNAFDNQAQSYEKLYGDQSEFEKEIVEKRKNLILNSKKAETVLDLGCGTGTFLRFISKKAKKVFAVDASEKMIQKAKKRVDAEKLSNVQIQFADALKLPFEKDFFDTVYCINTFYHIKDKEKVISEISRVLKKNGTAYIEFYNVLNPFAFLRTIANHFAKNMPHVYPDFIPGLKKKLEKQGLKAKKLEVFSYVETSEAVRHWLPSFLFNALLRYKKFSEKYTVFRLPKMRCVFETTKNKNFS